MLSEIFSNKNVGMVAGGMAGIMIGSKAAALGLFARGIYGLEKEWRAAHPEFRGSLADRWRIAIENYDRTHQNRTNRILHTVGIPMIVGGAIGLIAAPAYTPPWWVSNASWSVGWALNFVGHGLFEQNAPAFAQDPLSFIAGPVWDVVRLRDKVMGKRARPEETVPDLHHVATA